MSVQDLSSFTEFDEYLNPTTGHAAVVARCGYRMDIFNTDIPYYPRGKSDAWVFGLGDFPIAEIKLLLGDIDPSATFDIQSGRIALTQVGISLAVPTQAVQTMQTQAFT